MSDDKKTTQSDDNDDVVDRHIKKRNAAAAARPNPLADPSILNVRIVGDATKEGAA